VASTREMHVKPIRNAIPVYTAKLLKRKKTLMYELLQLKFTRVVMLVKGESLGHFEPTMSESGMVQCKMDSSTMYQMLICTRHLRLLLNLGCLEYEPTSLHLTLTKHLKVEIQCLLEVADQKRTLQVTREALEMMTCASTM
jgi:hypothetical protein